MRGLSLSIGSYTPQTDFSLRLALQLSREPGKVLAGDLAGPSFAVVRVGLTEKVQHLAPVQNTTLAYRVQTTGMRVWVGFLREAAGI
jgi:hypothetical protein